jgi:hypothetical protein
MSLYIDQFRKLKGVENLGGHVIPLIPFSFHRVLFLLYLPLSVFI